MRPTPLLALAAFGVLALPACRREEPLPPPPPPKPASPWTAAVSGEVSRQLVEAAARDPWTSQFRDRNGRAAKVAVGSIQDRSGREVPVAGLVQAIADAVAGQGGEKLAPSADGQADFLVQGAIGAQDGTQDGQAVIFFAVDLKFVDAKNGDPVWPFSIERAVARP